MAIVDWNKLYSRNKLKERLSLPSKRSLQPFTSTLQPRISDIDNTFSVPKVSNRPDPFSVGTSVATGLASILGGPVGGALVGGIGVGVQYYIDQGKEDRIKEEYEQSVEEAKGVRDTSLATSTSNIIDTRSRLGMSLNALRMAKAGGQGKVAAFSQAIQQGSMEKGRLRTERAGIYGQFANIKRQLQSQKNIQLGKVDAAGQLTAGLTSTGLGIISGLAAQTARQKADESQRIINELMRARTKAATEASNYLKTYGE